MSAQQICPDCGSTLPPDAPRGLCPRCLMGAALGRQSSRGDDATAAHAREPGVLETLALSIGPVPRVLLRDTTPGEEPGPILRPGAHSAPADSSIRYRIDGEIARGGMGAVLKGRDPDLGRDVALKVLREDLRENADLVRRFVEEAQIGGQLQHPGIVPIYELGTFADRRPFFAMKLVKGHTLAALLSQRPDPCAELPRFLSVFEAVCQTVAYAHARGVIHRDLKPSNVMVGSFGEVQVMDWGLAKVLPRGGVADDATAGKVREETVIATARSGSDSDLSRAGSVLGTPSYMAPEQARGETDLLGERCDVFALGSILCEVLTGRPAFVGRTAGEIQRRAARGETADALARLDASGAEAELVALARDCLAAEPEDRPGDASAVAGRVTAYLSGVQEWLRATEAARAAEAARAEESKRTAEAAEARARAERKARRLTLALSWTFLGLITLGGAAYVAWDRQQTARRSAAESAIETALGIAEVYRRDARLSRGSVLNDWATALAELKPAEEVVRRGEAGPKLAARVAAVKAEFTRESMEAGRYRDLLSWIFLVRSREIELDNSGTDVADLYAYYFQESELDIDAMDPEQFGAALANRVSSVELAEILDDWAARSEQKRERGSERFRRLVQAARVADPEPWRDRLRSLWLSGSSDQLRLELERRADDPEVHARQPVPSLMLLALLLGRAGDKPRAHRVTSAAWSHAPGDFWINSVLGGVGRPGGFDGLSAPPEAALRHLVAAVAATPTSVAPGLLTAQVWIRLGEALRESGDSDGARDADREANRLDSQLHWKFYRYGTNLLRIGVLDEAIAALGQAIRLEPGNYEAHANLGRALARQGKRDEAVAAFRRSAELAPPDSPLSRELPELIRQAEQPPVQSGQPPPVLEGDARTRDNKDRLALVPLCFRWQRYALAARLLSDALETDPKLADDREAAHRYNAACAAVLAAEGRGRDEPPKDDAARTKLRGQALGWLRAERDVRAEILASGKPGGKIFVLQTLTYWRNDSDLAGVRDPAALAKLPEPERKDWQALWADVDRLLMQAGKHR